MPAISRPAKIFAIGAGLAILTVVSGYVTKLTDEANVASLVARCNAEAKSTGVPPWSSAPLVCEPSELSRLTSGDGVAIQKQIVDAYSTVGDAYHTSVIAAILLFLRCSIPFAWYFFLRRIRELFAAIRNDG
jgi:hypothetical protein